MSNKTYGIQIFIYWTFVQWFWKNFLFWTVMHDLVAPRNSSCTALNICNTAQQRKWLAISTWITHTIHSQPSRAAAHSSRPNNQDPSIPRHDYCPGMDSVSQSQDPQKLDWLEHWVVAGSLLAGTMCLCSCSASSDTVSQTLLCLMGHCVPTEAMLASALVLAAVLFVGKLDSSNWHFQGEIVGEKYITWRSSNKPKFQ